jgi:hypothetical protein
MAFGIDLDRIQREAEFQLKIYDAGQQAIKDLQIQARATRGGGDPDWWDGAVGEPQFGLGGKDVLTDGGKDRPTMSEETRQAMAACPIDGYNGKPGIWVWTDEANFIGHCTEDTSTSPRPDGGDGDDPPVEDPYLSFQKQKGIASAKAMMKGFLNQFGLGGAVNPDGSVDPDLTKWALGMAESGLDGDAIVFEMRYGTDPTVRAAYDSVFPAMAERRKAGYSAITETEYINLTRGYTQIASAAGIDPDFLAGAGKTVAADGITALIAGDVSLAEWRDRVDLAEWSANNVDPYVKGILQTNYGYTNEDLVMYFLDPKRATNIKKAQQQVGGAKISAAGMQATGGMLGREFADYAYGQDIQPREVVSQLSPFGALTGGTLYEEGMTSDEIAWGRFGDSEQRDRLRRERERRTSRFEGAGGLAATSAGIIGAGAVST